MTDHGEHAGIVYQGFAAIAGSITALSMLKWRVMTWPEVLMTVFVGTSFSIFVVPWLAADVAGMDISNPRVICGATYMGATGANILIPMVLRKFRALVGLEEAS